MSLKQFGLLKKFMARTTSDADAEALGAIRMANRFLGEHGLTWDAVFSRTVTVISEITGETLPHPPADDLEDSFHLALGSSHGSFRETILDIYAKYQRGETLSPRQREVVEDAADRAADRHPGRRTR